MSKLFFFVSLVHLYNTPSIRSQTSKIDPGLSSRLAGGEQVDVVVSFQNGVRTTLETARSLRSGDRGVDNKALVEALQKNADESQEGVTETLSVIGRGVGGFTYFTRYWTSNRLFIKKADMTTVESVAEDPQVSSIQVAPVSRIPIPDEEYKPVDMDTLGDPGNPEAYWNLRKVQVTEAWEELGGSQGEGVVVGAIDTGVLHTHPTLIDKYLGDYGWFDGVNGTLEPEDLIGHGTHVTGVMVGKKTGVAPGAKFMMCRGCEDRECSFEAIMNCIRFISCPTLADGSNADCSKAPRVINFSIGGEREGEPYEDDFLTMKNLGIIPVASAGNNGTCASTESPSNLPFVISVGGTEDYWGDYDNESIWRGSSIGPAPDGRIKPDLVAPGEFILGADTDLSEHPAQLKVAQGTSTSAPHVSAVIALLHVRNMELTFEEAYAFITETADTDIELPYEWDCLGDEPQPIPNNFIGYGRVNAYKAVKAQTDAIGGS